jgi:hypothetical protein
VIAELLELDKYLLQVTGGVVEVDSVLVIRAEDNFVTNSDLQVLQDHSDQPLLLIHRCRVQHLRHHRLLLCMVCALGEIIEQGVDTDETQLRLASTSVAHHLHQNANEVASR